jgi:hypothetical protein
MWMMFRHARQSAPLPVSRVGCTLGQVMVDVYGQRVSSDVSSVTLQPLLQIAKPDAQRPTVLDAYIKLPASPQQTFAEQTIVQAALPVMVVIH